MKYYVLKKIGTGVLAYAKDFTKIKEYWREETNNGIYTAGIEIKKIEIPDYVFECNYVEGWKCLNQIAAIYSGEKIKIK